MRKYTYYQDPGHGWLRVPFEDLVTMDLVDKISAYSYISTSGKWAYLEEDRDMFLFLNALWNAHVPKDQVSIVDKYTDRYSRIRSYPGFNRWSAESFPMERPIEYFGTGV